jgi:hypothetical protein
VRAAEIVKIAIAVGILGLVGFTMLRGQGWWWRLSKPTRVALAAVVTVGIVAAGFMYKSQHG